MNLEPTEPARVELARAAGALSPAVRQQLAAEWARAAQFEHASIASFGRFALELLALGAPPQLVADAHRAALDEVRHAQLCFTLASVYANEPIGPGPLPLDARAFASFDLHTAVHSAVIEGCVGETLAAVEAAHVCSLSAWPAVRSVLATIAREESEHAGLAFRFVSWAVSVHGSALRTSVRAAFDTACAQLRSVELPQSEHNARTLLAHGRLCARERHVLRLRALDQLIAPLAHELCPRTGALS